MKYNEKIGDEICDAISTTHKGLSVLIKENPHWPCETDIFRWISNNEHFKQQYSRAKVCQISVLVEKMLTLLFDDSKDYIDTEKGKKIDHYHINRVNLICDNIKWLACKLCRKVYGESAQPDHEDDKAAIRQAKMDILKIKEQINDN